MPWRSFLPQNNRQWAGFILFLFSFALALWQADYFAYKQKLRAIEEKEWKFWTTLAKENKSAIIVVDADTGKITGWNSGATSLLGWAPDEVAGSNWLFLVPFEYIRDRYGNMQTYLDKAMAERTHEDLLGTVKIISGGKVNTKSGNRLASRISVRTVGSTHHYYVVQIDPEKVVEEVTPHIDVPTIPTTPPMNPEPSPDGLSFFLRKMQ